MPLTLTFAIAACLALLPLLGSSQAVVQTSRYTSVYAAPTDAQRDPLAEIVTIGFPDDIETIGQAVKALLSDTGYRLEDVLYWDAEVFELVQHSVPRVQRELGPLTVLDAINTVVGSAFDVVVDPVHRTIAFKLVRSTPLAEVDAPPEPERRRKRGRAGLR